MIYLKNTTEEQELFFPKMEKIIELMDEEND